MTHGRGDGAAPAATRRRSAATRRSPDRGFVELHVEQGRDLVDRGAAVGVASGIWPHGRYRFDFPGEANHAGTTAMEDRRDPMLTYAMTALAASSRPPSSHGERATVRPGRRRAQRHQRDPVAGDRPGSTPAPPTRTPCRRRRRGGARRAGAAHGGTVTAESVDRREALRRRPARRLAASLGPAGRPPVDPRRGPATTPASSPTAGIPTAMLFVRNPTGVSHSPDEHAERDDCLAGVEALADALDRAGRQVT